jgi:hypothetical protein
MLWLCVAGRSDARPVHLEFSGLAETSSPDPCAEYAISNCRKPFAASAVMELGATEADSMKAHDHYALTRDKEGWALVLNGRVLASGMERERAEQAVAVAARMSSARGRNAVLVRSDRAEPSRSLRE